MATHSSVLAWRIPGTGNLVGCRLWGCTKSDTTEATQQQQHQNHIKEGQSGFPREAGTERSLRYCVQKKKKAFYTWPDQVYPVSCKRSQNSGPDPENCKHWLQCRQVLYRMCVLLVAQSCLTLSPHGLQPTSLLCPWNSQGKNTGVGSHSFL